MRMTNRCFKKIFWIMICWIVSVLFLSLSVRSSVYAGEGYGGGQAIRNCDQSLPLEQQTSYINGCIGAVWRWYPTNSNSVYIPGSINYNTCAFDGFTNSGYITGCAEYGGYWRYAFITVRDWDYRQYRCSYNSYLYRYQQVGLQSIGTYGAQNYMSSYFGGGVNYRYGYDRNDGTWDQVRSLYEALKARYPSIYTAGWNQNSSLSWFCGPSTIEEVVQPKRQYTLTGTAVDTNGASLRNVMTDVSSRVEEGQYASVTRRDASGYTFMGWKNSIYDSSYVSTSSSYGTYLSGDKTIYAVYGRVVQEDRGEFSARARVFEGDNTFGTNFKSTGFRQTADLQYLYIDCLNTGCKATFDIYLKLERGTDGVSFYETADGYKYYPTYSTPASMQLCDNGLCSDPDVRTLYPGQQGWCWTLPFNVHGKKPTGYESYEEIGACAIPITSYFYGYSKVETSSGTTISDWVNQVGETTFTQVVSNCPITGCRVKFSHYLSRVQGIGWTDYTITRMSNYQKQVGSATLKNEIEYFNGVANNDYKLEYTEELTLLPGQVVCESLRFKPDNNIYHSNDETTIKMCASALGNAQPNDPSDPALMEDEQLSDAFLDMRVKNASGPSKYQKYQKNVYAKPGHVLNYRATYNPLLQYTYYIIPQKFRLNGSGAIYPSGINLSSTLGAIYNQYRGNMNSWNNAFAISSDFGYSGSFFYDKGSSSKQVETNSHRVGVTDVGRNLSETAQTNLNNQTSMTPGQVSFTLDGNKNNVGNVYTSSRSSQANAYVPYNYDTKLIIEEPDNNGGNNVVVAGEEKTIKYEIDVLPKTNPVTTDGSENEKYATLVRDAVSKIVIYTGDEKGPSDGWGDSKTNDVCNYFGLVSNNSTCILENERTEMLNASGNTSGEKHKLQLTINIPDTTAGTRICVAVASYPSNSGVATNWNDSEGSHRWRISESYCYLVAKKPAYQVWGGSLYSGSTIKTSVVSKNQLKGIGRIDGNIVFGSWAEQVVNAQGAAVGIASGAAMGLANNVAGGGSYEKSGAGYCNNRVPLSLANYSEGANFNTCPHSQVTGNSGISATISNKQSLVGTLPNEDSYINTYNSVVAITLSDVGAKNIIRYNSEKDIKINTSTINEGKTHIVKTARNVTINGNIEYKNETYSGLADIPKVIIYGDNITINCNVTRIDAILIAEKDLNTCVSANINSRENSHSLRINGAIVAGKLLLNRTYGAATGVNSKVPAEIVNYDVSTLLWIRALAEPGRRLGALSTVSTHELAPRY